MSSSPLIHCRSEIDYRKRHRVSKINYTTDILVNISPDPRPETGGPIFGLVSGMPEPSGDIGMLIVRTPPPPQYHPLPSN